MKGPIAGSMDFPKGNAPHTHTNAQACTHTPSHTTPLSRPPFVRGGCRRVELWIYDWRLERQSCLLCWNWGQSRGIGELVAELGGGRENQEFRGPRRGQELEETD